MYFVRYVTCKEFKQINYALSSCLLGLDHTLNHSSAGVSIKTQISLGLISSLLEASMLHRTSIR